MTRLKYVTKSVCYVALSFRSAVGRNCLSCKFGEWPREKNSRRVFERRKTLGQEWNVREKQWAQMSHHKENKCGGTCNKSILWWCTRGRAVWPEVLPASLVCYAHSHVAQSFRARIAGESNSLRRFHQFFVSPRKRTAVNTASVSTVVKLTTKLAGSELGVSE